MLMFENNTNLSRRLSSNTRFQFYENIAPNMAFDLASFPKGSCPFGTEGFSFGGKM